MRFAFAALALSLACGCPGHGGVERIGPAPSVEDLVKKIAARRTALQSFTGQSVMDYWLGKDRLKGSVLVMGKPGAHVRFAAESPAGGDTIAEMACDGQNFVFIDKQQNCQLMGPCDAMSIATFLHVELEPEDFIALALGTPPVVTSPTGTVTWDPNGGFERVELVGQNGKQSLVIDDKGGKLDVISSKLTDAGGKLVWGVENKDFTEVTDEAGVKHRVPMKTKLVSPTQGADLEVAWGDRRYNPTLDDPLFKLDPIAGLATCGQKPPAKP